ncbi:MAG: tetratricopeptide repeat protein, partial [Bdellovibrionales bacterium]|nr:tetratricopeptide repeat protein [Bdellovibrionales bacterium]
KGTSAFTPLAHYKTGWCYINKTKFKEALLSFEYVLTSSKNVDLKDLPELYKKTDVRRDALMAMVWPYSEMSNKELTKMGRGRVDTLKYFYQLSPNLPSYEAVLMKLARRLGLKHRYLDTTQIYFEVLRITENLERRLDVIERLYVSMKNTQTSWPVHGYVSEITKTIADVVNDEKLTPDQKKKAFHDFEIFARDVATRSHKRAKKTGKKEDWLWAIRDYETYLWAFPGNKYERAIEVNLAESYYLSGNLISAAKMYEKIADKVSSKRTMKGLLESSIEAYIGAIRNQAKLSRLEVTEVRFGLRSVGAKVIKNFPKLKSVPDIQFNIAQTYYDERNFPKAIAHFENYIAKNPNHKKVSIAANLVLDAFNQKEDYKGLVSAGKKILTNKSIRDGRLKSQVRQIIEQAEMKQVEAKSGAYGSKSYATNLLKLARKYKGSNLGDRALYEAFVAFKSKKDPQAYTSGEQLLMQHGKSKYAQEVVTAMGQMALITADFRRAALYFELYFDRYRNQKDAKELLASAAKMREAMGDFKIAGADYEKLRMNYDAARMDFLSGDWTGLLRSAPRAGGFYAAYWDGIATYRLKGLGSAQGSLRKAVQMAGGSYEEKEGAAHALYLLAAGELERYETIRMKRGQETKAVNNKSAQLKSLTAKLNQVIQYGNGRWSIAALYGLGKANREFANFILKAPVPKGLTGAQKQQYQSILKQQAAGYVKIARDFFRQCLATANKFEVLTEFTKGCASMGKRDVDESLDTRIVAESRSKAPPAANGIRQKLYDNSRNTGLLESLALSHLQIKDYSMTELILSRAIEINPNSASLIAKLGVVKIFKNQLHEARDHFKKALRLNKKEGLAYKGLEALYRRYNISSRQKQMAANSKRFKAPTAWLHPWMK